ncbi:MAG: SAF domain-containing protein [Chloroflexota bacterium]
MFAQLLAERAANNNPIRVAIIGAGKFGGGTIAQISLMKGIEVSVVADLNLSHARIAFAASHIDEDELQVAKNANDIDDTIRSGKRAVIEDGLAVSHSDLVDAVVEATGIPDVGARMAYEAITNGKHVVMVNVEADVTIGPILRRLADSAGVTYTCVDGDQPGCTMNIIEWATALGFEIVAAGRGTIFLDDDRAGTPDTVPERFGFSDEMLERRSINLKMFNTFRDGTKAQVEMTALANMAGLVPDVRGMHEPSVNLADIPQRFSLQDEGGLLSQTGVIELANSVGADGQTMLPDPLKMGVFAVIRTEHPFIQEDMQMYHLHPGGNGNNYLLYRPYHLVAIEAPISIAQAVLFNKPTGTPLPTPMAEVITVAKRPLEEGETLDGGGGYTVNGISEKATIAHRERLLPLGLAYGARLNADVEEGQAITYDMVELKTDTFVYKLRQLQDATVW